MLSLYLYPFFLLLFGVFALWVCNPKKTWAVCYHHPCGDGGGATTLYTNHLRSSFKGRIILVPLFPRGKLTLKPEWGKVIGITFLDTLPRPDNLVSLVRENPDTKITLIDHHFPVIRDFLKDPRLEFSADESRNSTFSVRVWGNVDLITPKKDMSSLEMVRHLFPDAWSGVPPMMKKVLVLVSLADIGMLGKTIFQPNWMGFSEETFQKNPSETERWLKNEKSQIHMTLAYSWKLKAHVANMEPDEFDKWVSKTSEEEIFRLMNYPNSFSDYFGRIYQNIIYSRDDTFPFLYYFVQRGEKTRNFTTIINTLAQQNKAFPFMPIFYIFFNIEGVCFQGRHPKRRSEDLDLADLAKSVNPTCGGHASAASIFLPMDFVIGEKTLKEIFLDTNGQLIKEICLFMLNHWIESYIDSM